MVVLVVAKLAMVRGQLCHAIGYADYDDALYLRLAQFIADGIWLGPYNALTLVRGPMYPLWIAAVHQLGVPLFLGQHLLYAFACWMLIRALRPLGLHPAAELFVFALVLFNPMTWSAMSLRVIRTGIYPATTLLVVAAAIGVHTHRDRSSASLAFWSTFLGIAFTGFWLTREEGPWLVPTVILLLGASLISIWRFDSADRWRRLGLASCSLVAFSVAIAAVCSLNLFKYGIFTTVEAKRHEFLAAYGALLRVSSERPDLYGPVPMSTRDQIYRVSPAFRELRPDLDNPLWFPRTSDGDPKEPMRDHGSGVFRFAFRRAVERAGYYTSGERAMAYYKTLAREVNDACEQSMLECDPQGATGLAELRIGKGVRLGKAVLRTLRYLIGFEGFSAAELKSSGTPWQLRGFEEMTGEAISTEEKLAIRKRERRTGGSFVRAAARTNVGKAYQSIFKWWLCASLIAWAWAGVRAWQRRSIDVLFVVTTSLALATASRVAMLAWVDVTMFPVINPLYLSPAYPLMLAFSSLAVVAPLAVKQSDRG